ncbi:hypothetical protein Q8A73_012181 [Channa argus]|nr:hypothetical protein Q8A73_012181 [Channa argus]
MATQVEVQTGEVGRTVAAGRHHLSPLTDSSNKNLIDISPISQSHIITPEPNKSVPGPKPRLTPKPFVVDKNPTIKPILAPKPQTKPRPESTRLAGYLPELPCSAKPQQPVATGQPRPMSTNPNRPAPTTFKMSNKLNTGQTTKPVVQPFKPAFSLDPGDPSKPTFPIPAERRKTAPKSLAYSKSLKKTVAECPGTNEKEDEKDQVTSCKGGAPITRAKSMGCLDQLEQKEEEKEKEKAKAVASVPLRPQPRSARPRPVSAIFLDSPTKTETPVPAPRLGGRRPLSADLTSKFESIGLSLHRKTPKANTKENTPEEKALPQLREQEKTLQSITLQSPDGVAKPAISDHNNKKTDEMDVKDTDERECGTSIKSRISLLLDSSSSPGTAVTGQGSDLNSPVQVVSESEPPVGVKQLIKQLTEDTTPTQSPVMKPALKPRPLPLDLTKLFSSEKSPDLGSGATDLNEISKDPQRRTEESAVTPRDQMTFMDFTDSQAHVKKAFAPEGPEAGEKFGPTSKESSLGIEVQTVRASLFENIVERHSVLMVNETKPVNKFKETLSSPSFKRGCNEDEGTVVTATYKEPLAPSSPLQVVHAFDTLQAVEENRAVSENIPSAHWEDKAMTLRSRRSEGSLLMTERTGSAQQESALTLTAEQHPRYLRVGALQKWTTTDFDQHKVMEKGKQTESQREVAIDKKRDEQKEAEQEEVCETAKNLKKQPEEQPKAKATYFALTAQIQEPVSPVYALTNEGGMTLPFNDLAVRTVVGGSRGKILPVRRNPSLDEAFGKIFQSQDQVDDSLMGSQLSNKEIRSVSNGQTEEIIEVEKNRELKRETESHLAKMRLLERDKQRKLDLEKQAHLEFAKMKETEMQREFERQRQKGFEMEKQELEEKRHALERQKQIELEKHKLQQLEREKQRELERERQRQLEREKQLELDRPRQSERERMREQERERLRQREEERQREQDMERHLEIQKEKMEELERMKELERHLFREYKKQKQIEKEKQQVLELEKQIQREKLEREAEKIKQMALDQEIIRLKELERERERQREMEKERQKKLEWEKQRELERQRQRDLERERQRQLDLEKQELENQRLRQEQERERQRKDELEKINEMERRQLLEFEKQKQAERERQQIFELEKKRLREKMEREEAQKIRQIAKQQEAERQRQKEKQKKEEQERARSEASPLRPKVVDLDSVFKNDPLPKVVSQRSDPAMRWKEPSPIAEESYKPAILDIDSFTSQTTPSHLSPSKDLFPVPSFQGVDTSFGTRSQTTPERDVSWKVPPQTSGNFSSPLWTTSPQDPWELWPNEMSVDKPVAELKKHANRFGLEQLLVKQEERQLASQRHLPAVVDDPFYLAPFPQSRTVGSPGEGSRSPLAEPVWVSREPQRKDTRGEIQSHRRSQGSQELNRMRSRSVSRRSAPSSSAEEGGLSRLRSRSAHRERDRYSWVQQKQSVRDEEDGKDSETPVCETDSQYGTWETGLRTDDSLTPATPSSESNLSLSPRKPTPPHTPAEHRSQFETDSLDGLLPSSSETQLLSFPDAPTTLLDTSALRSRAQLGKKRAPRTRPTRAARQSAVLAERGGETTEDWLYRDSTEAKVEGKEDESDSEDKDRGADTCPAVGSQPQRIALFPGVDPSALKAQLKKRGDSENQTDGPSQPSRSPKSPFLPRAARVLPTPGGKENGEEDSPQWLKELKSKKRLSQYENES